MKPVKCLSGHFFDADKFDKCPQCGAARADGVSVSYATKNKPMTPAKGENKTVGVFERGSSLKSKLFSNIKSVNDSSSDDLKKKEPVSLLNKDSEKKSIDIIKEHSTSSNFQSNNIVEIQPAKETISEPAPVVAPAVNTQPEIQVSAPAVVVSTPVVETPAPSSDSLLSEIKKVSNDNGGKTVGFFSATRNSSNSESAAPSPINEPLVGWLVCVKGVHFGEGFPIYSGRNSIGRNNDNKICLSRDNTISREKHAWIVYEPKKRKFFVQPGEGSGLVYVNDDMVSQLTEIKRNEKLEIGDALLMLVPLCCEDFSWEEYTNN